MVLLFILVTTLLAFTTAQSNPKEKTTKQNEPSRPVLYIGTPPAESQKKDDAQLDLKQFYDRQQFSPELYGLTYLEPQYQADGAFPRLQPQIVLYGPGGQGQPILINPGNPPGNFLIPQAPGPNVIFGDNPQQRPVFPAGYPKPAHIPPIEKDAEEIPTNPAKIPPLSTQAKPTKPKPEKLESFNDIPSIHDQNSINNREEQYPKLVPGSLRPGQRFFVLNGDNIYNFPFEAVPESQAPAGLRYTNIQPFPENPPKFLHQSFSQQPPQFIQKPHEIEAAVPPTNTIHRNTVLNLQQPESHLQQANLPENFGALNHQQVYFRTAPPINHQENLPLQVEPFLHQARLPLNLFNQGIVLNDGVGQQPQSVGQFRFTPNGVPNLYQFADDVENDAIVVDASFGEPNNVGRGVTKADESESTTTPQPNSSEPSMAQAAPGAIALAGPGGVAGAGPRGTAIVGKGGLAVSSPQATAVAGTKEEEKKPIKKNAA